MRRLIDHVVDEVPGVDGALVSSADGFVLAARLPPAAASDASAVAAMSAASLGLSNRLVELTGPAATTMSHHRSSDGQVFVFEIARVAVLTVLTDETADATQIRRIGDEIRSGLERVLRNTAPA